MNCTYTYKHQSQFIEMFGNQDTNDKLWRTIEIKEAFTLNMGKTPSRAKADYWVDSKNGFKWISIADMANYSKYTNDTTEYISQNAIDECGMRAVEPGTIIMSFKLSIGRTAITSEKVYTNEAIMAFKEIYDNLFNKDFVYFAFTTKNWLLEAKRAVKGATLNKDSIGKNRLIVPPIYLQDQFANLLKQADKSKFDGFKSQFIEMFGNVTESKVLSELIEVSYPGEWGKEPQGDGDVKVLRTTNFCNDGHLDYSDVVLRNIEQHKIEKKRLKKYDIILERSGGTKDNPVGRVVLFDSDDVYLFNNFTQLLRPSNSVNPFYLFYYLYSNYNADKASMRAMASQTTGIQNLSMSDYMAKSIPTPSITEQNQFEQLYRQADKSKYYELN